MYFVNEMLEEKIAYRNLKTEMFCAGELPVDGLPLSEVATIALYSGLIIYSQYEIGGLT